MCGFLGIAGPVIPPIQQTQEQLKTILHHRGPDYSAVVRGANYLLVHNRLSIIDLSDAANQPFVSPRTGNLLVYNGEIYNFRELKQKYAHLPWTTQSDTEVILQLYEALGPDFVQELNGIFAFAILDKQNQHLLLYRDRVGVKPLYFSIAEEQVFFSSEIKGILPLLPRCSLNCRTIYDYLEHGLLCHNEDTFIQGVYRLMPGHYRMLNLGSLQSKTVRYWDVDLNRQHELSENEIYEEALYLLKDAMRLNLVSDVEVGICLSSGLDSTLLYHLMDEQEGSSLKAFSYGFREPDYDEVVRIQQNQYLPLKHHETTYVAPEAMLDLFQEAIGIFEGPLGGLGVLTFYHMMKTVRERGIKVVLSGEGSDEIFGGYKYYYPAFFKDIEAYPDLLQSEMKFYNKAHGEQLEPHTQEYQAFLKPVFSKGVISNDNMSLQHSYSSPELHQWISDHPNAPHTFPTPQSALQGAMYRDLKQKRVPKALFFADCISMSSSVESRVPFLDHRLIEWMYAAPSSLKIRRGRTKYIARKVLASYFDASLYSDVKHYVSSPQREWLKSILYNSVLDRLRGGMLSQSGLVDFEKFTTDYSCYHRDSALGNSFFVWKMLNLEFLLQHFSKFGSRLT